MPTPATKLHTLITLAACTGAILYGKHLNNSLAFKNGTRNPASQKTIDQLQEELQQLQDENLALRQLAAQSGDIALPSELLEFIEKDIGLTFNNVPFLIKSNYDAIQKAAEEKWTSYFGWEEMQLRSVAFQEIGLLPPESPFVDQMAIALTGPNSTRALYDYGKDRAPLIMVPPDFDLNSQIDSAALVQMLALALIEQHHPAKKKQNDDLWNARQALIHAQALKTRTFFTTKTARQFEVLTGPIQPTEAQLNAAETFQSLPLYVRQLAGKFGATHGRDFLDRQKADSKQAPISQALQQKINTQQILQSQLHKTNKNKTKKVEDTVKSELEEKEEKEKKEATEQLLQTQLGALALLTHAQRGSSINQQQQQALLKSYQKDTLDISAQKNKLHISWNIQFSEKKQAQLFALHLKDLRPKATISLKKNAKVSLLSTLHHNNLKEQN